MADGSMAGDKVLEVADLSDGFAYMPNLQKGLAYVPKYGACDPLMSDQFQRETPFRFATAFFRWTRGGGGELVLAATASTTLFGASAGVASGGEAAGAGAGSTLSRSDTNAFDQGGVAKQGNKFIAVAVSVQPLAPFTVVSGAVTVGSAAVRRRQAWFSGGTDYGAECQRLLFDAVNAQLQHGSDTACQYNLGPIAHWISGSPSEQFKPSVGIPGAFTYLAVPDVSGNRNAGDNFNLVLGNTCGLQVDSDALNPTQAGFDFVTPVRFALVGFPLCDSAEAGGSCAPGNGQTEARLSKMERMLSAMFDRMQGGNAPPQLPDGKAGGRSYR